MKIIENEQEIKSKSLFLQIKDKSILILKSHLVLIETAFDEKNKRNLLWSNKLKLKKSKGFYYLANLNGEEGVVRLPVSIISAMNEIERLKGVDKRSVKWLIGKKGERLNTRYTVVSLNQIQAPDEEEIKKNTERLKKLLINYESRLAENLKEFLRQIDEEEQLEEVKPSVNPSEIPLRKL